MNYNFKHSPWIMKKKILISFCWVTVDNLKRKTSLGYISNMLFFTLLSYAFFNWSPILGKQKIWYHLKCTCSRVLRYQIHIRMFWLYLFAGITSITSLHFRWITIYRNNNLILKKKIIMYGEWMLIICWTYNQDTD